MKELVLVRLSSMPENIQLHIGNNSKMFDKDSLIREVKRDSVIGKKFVELQKEYIKSTIRGFTQI